MSEKHPQDVLPLLSIVVPVFNEEALVAPFHARLSQVVQDLGWPCEIVFVDDGSQDGTWEALCSLHQQDARITLLSLSRNFGKEIALSAGLEQACGELVVVIDVDLQDPPELIHEFIRYWEQGYDVVYGQRVSREGESWLKKLTAYLFYRLLRQFSRVDIPADTGDFRLMSRRAVDAVLQCREHHRFMKGLFAWIGFQQMAVPYHRAPRAAGYTKFNYWKLWNFALEGITSFTTAPLKLASYVGFFTATVAFLYLVFVMGKTLLFGEAVQGYPSLMAVILCLGGVQLMTIGILGEYVARMFDETKGRPLYLLKELHAAGQSAPADRPAPEVVILPPRPATRAEADSGGRVAVSYRTAS